MTDTSAPAAAPLDLLTEEDLKLRVVAPLLERFGIGVAELTYEREFRVQVGKQTHATGRADIVFRRDGRNLFILELKRMELDITEADRRQVTSYALLAEPNVAPFCVVTNGRETQLIDTLSRQVLTDEELRAILKDGLTPSLSDELRREALRVFIGLSSANLTAICGRQVRDRTERVRQARAADDWKQYVAELYARPRALESKLREFRQSDARVLALAGPSGAGKTSALVSFADELAAQGEAVFFFLARDVATGIADAVAEELSWKLSSANTTVAQAIRRMVDALSTKQVYVIVDNFDELDAAAGRRAMETFLNHAPAQLKLVLTATERTFAGLLHVDGVATSLRDELRRSGDRYRCDPGELDEVTFETVVGRYEAYYECARPTSPALLAEARRDPFILRLAFESTRGGPAAKAFDPRAFYDAYFDRQLLGVDGADEARRWLTDVAEQLVNADADYLDETELRGRLAMARAHDIPLVLFRKNILTRAAQGTAGRIGFTYPRMRDFVYAVWLRRWDTLDVVAFVAALATLKAQAAFPIVAANYYAIATPAHRRALDEPAHAKACSLLDAYEDLRATHFPALLDAEAGGGSRFGFVGDLRIASDRPRITLFGFRSLQPLDERVLLLPQTSLNAYGDEAFAAGAHSLRWHADADGFGPACDPRALAVREISNDVTAAVKAGRVAERAAPVLLVERVLGRAAKLRRRLLRFPLALRDILLEVVTTLLGDKLAWERVVSGAAPSSWHGSMVAYTRDPGVPDAELRARAESLLRASAAWTLPADLGGYASTEDVALVARLGALAGAGTETITGPPVAQPAWAAPPEDRVRAVAQAYRKFLEAYRAMLGSAFPTLAGISSIARRPGVRCFVSPGRGRDGVCVLFCESTSDEVIECRLDELEVGRPPRVARFAGVDHRVFRERGTSCDRILSPSHGFSDEETDASLCVVRALVYGQLEDDLKEFLKTLA